MRKLRKRGAFVVLRARAVLAVGNVGNTLLTLGHHVANSLSKLGVHSQLQALVFALRYRGVHVS